ncbi:hypothetical protein KCU83_g1215, partial [Aureobasidium melanogenum]
MATNKIFDRLEAIFLAFNPPSQVDQSKHVWMRKDSLVIASRFVLAFNCKDGPDPFQAANTLTLSENQLAKEIWCMAAYLFQRPANPISYNAWTTTTEIRQERAQWNAYAQKPALTREDVASLAGDLGSQWLTHVDNCADGPLQASKRSMAMRGSRFEEIYHLHDHLREQRLYMGTRMDQGPQRRWNPYAPRNWAYIASFLRGHFDRLGRNDWAYQKAAVKLASNTTILNKEPSSIPSYEATTDTTNKQTIASEVNMVLDVAKNNRIWNVKHVLYIYELKEQDPTKVSFLNTEFARQAVHSIKLLHEKEGENGYGWDNPAFAMILRAVVKNDDDWLFDNFRGECYYTNPFVRGSKS